MTYASSASIYRQHNFAPIPVEGKSPVPRDCTGRLGTVTDEKITEWSNSTFWGPMNVALRAEGWISIDVDEYGDKHGAEQLAALEARLGLLPSTITSTARGRESPSRQHFFAVPDDRSFLTKPADDIEVVQRSHRYAIVAPSIHPETGAQYQWYDYDGQPLTDPPKLSDFEQLPEAWLEYLTVPEPSDSHAGFGGSIKAWLDILPQGDPTSKVSRLIEDIPITEFGHDTLVRLTFRLVRLGAENHTGIHRAVDLLYDAWTRPPFEEYAPAFAVALEGAIRKAGKPQAAMPALMRYADAMNDTTADFIDNILPGDLSTIAAEGYKLGLSDSHVLTLMWNSPAGVTKQLEPNALETMWREACMVRVAPPLPPVEERPSRYSMLTEQEREFVANQQWWGTQYLDWVRSRVDYYNAPFHRLGRWAVLSTIASPWGFTAVAGSRPTNCALYMAIPAPSTVGKTIALGFVEMCIDAFYGKKESPNLGTMSKLTSNALHGTLLRRDGKAAFIFTDEAQAFIRDIRETKWQGTLLGDVADYYGHGTIGAKQMNNDKEFSGIRGETFLTTYLTGIDDQMADAMDLSMWTSGLFYRFLWAKADPREKRKKGKQADPSFAGELDPIPHQWAAEFKDAQQRNEMMGKRRVVPWDDDAWDRHYEFTLAAEEALRDHPRFERVLEPALERFEKSIIKCATLIALIESSPKVTMRHELIAIEQAEEWLAGLVGMIDMTSESKFDRDVEELFDWLSQKQRTEAEVYRQFRPADRADRMLKQLEREGRVRRDGAFVGVVV